MVELVKFNLSHSYRRGIDFAGRTPMAPFKQTTTGKRSTTNLHAEPEGNFRPFSNNFYLELNYRKSGDQKTPTRRVPKYYYFKQTTTNQHAEPEGNFRPFSNNFYVEFNDRVND